MSILFVGRMKLCFAIMRVVQASAWSSLSMGPSLFLRSSVAWETWKGGFCTAPSQLFSMDPDLGDRCCAKGGDVDVPACSPALLCSAAAARSLSPPSFIIVSGGE
jgi:hypothetical protein